MLKYWTYRYIGVIVTVVAAVVIATAALLGAEWQLVLGLVGVAVTLIYSLQSQKREELRVFKDLFTEFNERYDSMNDSLQLILELPIDQPLETDHLNILHDYFNLCGEEYFFNKLGYIRREAWESWISGMRYYYADERIRKEWDRELAGGSYYGFSTTLLRGAASA